MDQIKIATVPFMILSKRDSKLEVSNSTSISGSLHLTPHHLIFRSTGAAELWIPLPLLHSVTRASPNLIGTTHPLLLRTRDYTVYDLIFPTAEEADGVWESLKGLCTGVTTNGLEGLYAFFYEGEIKQGEVVTKKDVKGKGRAGWNIYEPEKEFSRMGVGSRSNAWRFSNVNKDYQFCPTYPAVIVVPAKMSDTTLSYAVKYRSKGRIPGLVYLHWANLGSITRSSQPMVGLKNARSIQDEKLIEAIFGSHSQHSTQPARHSFTLTSPSSSPSLDGQVIYGAQATNLIIDARPTTNAMANSVKGAGTENMEHYRNCKKAYLGIDNIHVMRSSLTGVYDALRESEIIGQIDRVALRKTNWLKHLSNILDGILVITKTIHLSNSHVLVHCSDGWDRTSQLSSLAQLCLDPYYRTAEGLAVLIEKDWISYGHKFTDRTGHLCHDLVDFVPLPSDSQSTQAAFLASVQKQFTSSSHAFKETCPVFQQFLDCIYQIWRQFPERFEWNESYLRRLEWETYSGRSGTFLFNSEQGREELRGRERTRSVWEGIFDSNEEDGILSLKEEFKNPKYNKVLDDPDSRALDSDQGVLMVDPQDVKWWFELFGRSDEEMNGRAIEIDLNGDTAIVVEVQEDQVFDQLATSTASLDLNCTTTPSSINNSTTASRLLLSPTIPSPIPSRSASPSLPFSNKTRSTSYDSQQTPQDQLAGAVSSVQKFGWGAFKSLQKGYQEAVTQYRDASAVNSMEGSTNNVNLGSGGVASDPPIPTKEYTPSPNGPAAYVPKPRLTSNGSSNGNPSSTATASIPTYSSSSSEVLTSHSPVPISSQPVQSGVENPWKVEIGSEVLLPLAGNLQVVDSKVSGGKTHEGQVVLQESVVVEAFDPLGVGPS